MAPVNILKLPISSAADTSPLKGLKCFRYDSSQILTVVGKTEGMYATPSYMFSVILIGQGMVALMISPGS
jgi:hypothetical protein